MDGRGRPWRRRLFHRAGSGRDPRLVSVATGSAFGPKLTPAPKSQARVHVASGDRRHRCSSRSGCSHGGTADLDVGRGIVVDDGDT